MGPFGDVLGLPFAFEGLKSFFVEAIFLGITSYGVGPDAAPPPPGHADPDGVRRRRGDLLRDRGQRLDEQPDRVPDRRRPVPREPWRAMFNDGVWLQFAHMWIGAFCWWASSSPGCTPPAAPGAARRAPPARVHGPVRLRDGAAVSQPFVGHLLGLRLATSQPSKLAAFELAIETESLSPLGVGGLLIDGQVRLSIDIGARPDLAQPVHQAGAGAGDLRRRRAADQPRAPGVPVDGGPRHTARAGRGGPLGSLARNDLPDHRWFLWFAVAAARWRWSRRRRVDRDRGRPAAVDDWGVLRTSEAASTSGGPVVEPGRRGRRLPRDDGRGVRRLHSMARRWRAARGTCPARTGRSWDHLGYPRQSAPAWAGGLLGMSSRLAVAAALFVGPWRTRSSAAGLRLGFFDSPRAGTPAAASCGPDRP